MQQQRRVAAVIENHVGEAAVRPLKNAVGVFPVLIQRLALLRENRNTVVSDCGGRVILRRENVAGSPADFGTEREQRFDQHGGLNGHVERARDTGALQRGLVFVLITDGHQAGHFGFRDADLIAAPLEEPHVGDFKVVAVGFHIRIPVR